MSGGTISLDAYRGKLGEQVGVSRWIAVDQPRIDDFARITEDEQFIHIDPVAAAKTPFGGTIAHGFLSLSLLSAMAESALPLVEGTVMGINYGMNSLRFLTPVRSGKRIRAVFVLKDLQERSPGQWQSTLGVTVEIEGEAKPALIAEWLTLAIVAAPAPA